jgi:hypothetical protein
LRPDEPVSFEPPPREPPHEGHELTAKELRELPPPPAVYSLALALRSSDVAPPPKGVDVSGPGLDAARKKSEPSLDVDLTPGHARAVLHDGFVLPEGTEVRVRADGLGYIVVAADGESYRVGATGALRAILGEGLFDVAPSSSAEVSPHGEGPRRLGRATRRVDVSTRAAQASFDLARVPELGDAGTLVCRMLLDLMSAGPSTPACTDGDVPLHVELRWSAQTTPSQGSRSRSSGVTTFDATSLVRRTDAVPSTFATPPTNARFVATGEPVRGSHLFLTRADLTAMHLSSEAQGARGSEGGVLSLHNSTDELRFVWLDGVSLAWLAPGGRLDVSAPRVRVTVQWRTFLGDAIDRPQTVTIPATVDTLATPPTSSDNPPP